MAAPPNWRASAASATIRSIVSRFDPLAAFPDEIRVSTERTDLVYFRLSGLFAIHGTAPPKLTALTELNLPAEKITVCRGGLAELSELVQGEVLSPVYSLQLGGPPAIPSGLVYVRFAEGVSAEERQPQMNGAGYSIETVPIYAPHTAWVRATSREIADSLSGIEGLEQLADLENVEPQMLTESSRR